MLSVTVKFELISYPYSILCERGCSGSSKFVRATLFTASYFPNCEKKVQISEIHEHFTILEPIPWISEILLCPQTFSRMWQSSIRTCPLEATQPFSGLCLAKKYFCLREVVLCWAKSVWWVVRLEETDKVEVSETTGLGLCPGYNLLLSGSP